MTNQGSTYAKYFIILVMQVRTYQQKKICYICKIYCKKKYLDINGYSFLYFGGKAYLSFKVFCVLIKMSEFVWILFYLNYLFNFLLKINEN